VFALLGNPRALGGHLFGVGSRLDLGEVEHVADGEGADDELGPSLAVVGVAAVREPRGALVGPQAVADRLVDP
jgi:hypothetical protein